MQDPFRAIAEFTYDWESWIDPQGNLRWVNAAVERITGYGVDECLAMSDYPLPLVHDGDGPVVRRVLERALAGEPGNHVEFRVRRKDGELRWAAISWQAITVRGENVGFRTSVRDIHERKRMEAELQAAVRQAEEANHAKTAFLANVTHELRTPLQSIIGYAELLNAHSLPEPLNDYAHTMVDQGRQLERLVSDLLDFSSLQAGQLPLRTEKFTVGGVVDRVMKGFMPLAAQKDLELDWQVDHGIRVTGDPQRLAQVLSNLVGNAVRYTPAGRVVVRATAGDDAHFVVTVDDTGPGLPEGRKLFEPFRRGDNSIEHQGGVGLGLAISRELCSRMGGELTAAASPLGGARLTVTLPGAGLSPAAHVAHFDTTTQDALPDRTFAKRHPLRVLVVDDVEPARHFVREALRALGYAAEVAASADEAFALTDEGHFDVVLMDIQMPGVDGWSAARGVRARLGERTFLVALTAQATADDAERLTAAGFDGYAAKPIRLPHLQALLVRASEHLRLARASAVDLKDLFDPERLRELASIKTEAGSTLLETMATKVADALPLAVTKLEQATRQSDAEQAERALHEVEGLLGLIGSPAGRQAARLCRQGLERGALDVATWSELASVCSALVEALRAGRQPPHAVLGAS